MRSLLCQTLFCVSSLALSAGCSKDPAVPQLRELPMVAFVEETSFEDYGLKAIVFPRGVAFVMRFDTGDPIMEKVILSGAEQQLLLDTINHHDFFGLPRHMASGWTDGSSVRVLCADAHREHWIYTHNSEDSDFLAFQVAFVDVVSTSAEAAEYISASEFVEGVAAETEAFPKHSTFRNTAATFLDYMVRSQRPLYFGVDDRTRFTLPGKNTKLYRDVPSVSPELIENERKLMEEQQKAERRAGQEAPIVDGGLLLDLPHSGVDNLLPEPAPIVIDFPVLD